MKYAYVYAVMMLACWYAGPSWAQEQSAIAVRQIISTQVTSTGQEVEVPEHPRVIASTYELAPGATLPVHMHPYARYAYVLSGEVLVTDVETGKVFHCKAGDFVVEMRGQKHFGTNPGKEPARLLVIDQVPPGVESNTVMTEH